jgi:hypothetical protein
MLINIYEVIGVPDSALWPTTVGRQGESMIDRHAPSHER